MRKRLIPPETRSVGQPDWLGLETAAEAEVTSEDPAFPLESALGIAPGPGWRASVAGMQTVRLLFDHPMRVRRIHLEFREEDGERSQEFLLRWSADGGQTWREIVRQQYNFSSAATRELEDYAVDLNHVTALEIQIIPDLARHEAHASLHRLQVA
ncbi:MAG: hypothetical protein L0Y58_15440 [Verrucomicrobia subdivision 3 bacterium]|nr:hypothetical protein [Limisphaerales bacterium]